MLLYGSASIYSLRRIIHQPLLRHPSGKNYQETLPNTSARGDFIANYASQFFTSLIFFFLRLILCDHVMAQWKSQFNTQTTTHIPLSTCGYTCNVSAAVYYTAKFLINTTHLSKFMFIYLMLHLQPCRSIPTAHDYKKPTRRSTR